MNDTWKALMFLFRHQFGDNTIVLHAKGHMQTKGIVHATGKTALVIAGIVQLHNDYPLNKEISSTVSQKQVVAGRLPQCNCISPGCARSVVQGMRDSSCSRRMIVPAASRVCALCGTIRNIPESSGDSTNGA